MKRTQALTAALIVSCLLFILSAGAATYYGARLSAAVRAQTFPAEPMLQSVQQMLLADRTGAELQSQITAGITPDIVSFFVLTETGEIIAGYPAGEVGKSFGSFSFRREINLIPFPSFSQRSRPDPAIPRVIFQQRDPDDAGLTLSTYYVTSNSQKQYLVLTSWASSAMLLATRGLRGTLHYIDGLLRLTFALSWTLLAAWVYRDSSGRGGSRLGWGILTLLTGPVGWAVYLVARPRESLCPACRRPVDSSYNICPACGYALHERCPRCGKATAAGWKYCAYCGQTIGGQE